MLLVGHGSHLSPASAFPVHALAEEVRRVARDVEVRVAFWKEEPLLHQAFDLVESRRVFVVPVFTSEGYFTDSVLPRELGLRGETTVVPGRLIRYCPPVGTHANVAEIVLARAKEVAAEEDGRPAAATLVIVGHGTDRHPRSGQSTLDLVDAVRATGRFSRVEPAFLDQDPSLEDVLGAIAGEASGVDTSKTVVVVPFFVSDGWHAGTTIPRDLSATTDGVESVRLAYTRAVGTHPLMAGVVLDLVRDAVESASDEPPRAQRSGEDEEPSLARAAREDFIGWIRAAGSSGREFLETVVWETTDAVFEIRHRNDREAEPNGLATFEDPHDGGAIARTTDEGTYRPLSTTPDLRRGWRIAGLDERGVWDAFAGLYPTAPVHWHQARAGSLRVVGFDQAAARQTGMYARVGSLGQAAVSRLAGSLCGDGCLRVPRWRPDALPLAAEDDDVVPCLEPCSVFLSRALAALDAPEGSG